MARDDDPTYGWLDDPEFDGAHALPNARPPVLGRPHLHVMRSDAPPPEIPETPEALSYGQHVEAVARMHVDASQFFRFPLPSLHGLAGTMAPGELWVVGGRQGNGKSLFLQNVAWWLLEAGIPMLYMGTEQDGSTLKIKQACVIAGVRAKLMLKPTEEDMLTDEYRQGSTVVQETLVRLNTAPANRLLNFSNNRFISRRTLDEWTAVACGEWDAKVVIVDHLHHMQHGPGKNPVSELTETVQRAQNLAVDHKITMLCASQISRSGGDALKAFTPPTAEDFGGASAIERTADVCLTLWRPLRMDLTKEALLALREKTKLGAAGEDRVYEPMTMGVRCVKDRLGDAPGTQTMLGVDHGRLGELGRHQYRTDYDSLKTMSRPA